MNDIITIGHYATSAYCKADDLLFELTNNNFADVVNSIPVCPYSKATSLNDYKWWKSDNLPIVFFTNSKNRPSKDAVYASGYAVIDIDNSDVKYVTNHPSVCYTNYTGNGTHIYIHTNRWGITSKDWQTTYNSIAYEIWMELCNKYKSHIQFDGRCAKHTQGCFIWNTEWKHNVEYDREWQPEERYLPDSIIEEMYEPSSYTPADCGTYKDYSKKLNRVATFVDKGKTITELACISKVSDSMKKDFSVLNYSDFLEKYTETYTNISGTIPVWSEYTDYEGNTYQMFETRSNMVTLWQPFMQNRNNLTTTNGIKDYKIKIGGRRKSLASHLIQACQFSADKLDADHILWDAVYWIYNYCEEGCRFPKMEIMSTVACVLKSFDSYECRLHTDKRMFVTGPVQIDTETGEVTYMDKNDKIRANAKCRKTARIIEVVNMWNPNESIEWNADNIRSWENKTTKDLSNKTFKNYIATAKQMPELVSQYEWLSEIEFESRVKQSISIMNLETNEVFEFDSKSECMKFLGITNKMTFSRFLKGNTKFNKKFKAIQ